MNNVLYVGLSRQMTLKSQMDVIANNIANSETAGFKIESLGVREDPEQPNVRPGSSPVDTIHFVQHHQGLSLDFTQGALRQTGGTFDLGLQGQGMFQVQTAAGVRYTRDGRFTLDSQGQLVDTSGNPVLSSGGAPITIDRNRSAPSIAHDGTISQDGVIAGKIGVYKVANTASLVKQGSNLFDAPGQAGVVDPATQIQQGMIETSNVDPIVQMTKMISVSRAYEQVSSMIDQTNSSSDSSIQRLGRASN